jgi:RNAse (barnase) inhibitor barstar
MAAFRDEPGEHQRLDYRLFQSGPVVMYFDSRILEEDLKWLLENAYLVDVCDASEWHTRSEALAAIARQLEFPEYFGGNLDALNDCLGDLPVADGSGRAVVLKRYDKAVAHLGSFASDLLDVFATQSRRHLLHGRRLIALVQSDDPRLSVEPVGACPVLWNPREWLDTTRGV